MLCGNREEIPSKRSHTTRVFAPDDEIQSTLIESPGRKYDRDGSNLRYGKWSVPAKYFGIKIEAHVRKTWGK